jgi:Ni,Fe-hydrogenase III large subunit
MNDAVRNLVDTPAWQQAIDDLATGRATLVDLWGELATVHMAVFTGEPVQLAVLSLPCPAGRFPSVGQHHSPAIRLERTLRDLFGLVPEGSPDPRPWLDHGRWGVQKPLGDQTPVPPNSDRYDFLPFEGESLHQIPVGPVHAGIIEPGHFRFTCSGETVVRLEQRFGYVHKGIDALTTGASIDTAARLAGRVSGDSTVAYGIAFARAVEAAVEVEPPERAVWLRALMAELERIANHFGDIGAVCNDAAFALMHAHCGVLRERVLRQAQSAFGHRLMMDRVVPGGVAADLQDRDITGLRQLIGGLREDLAPLVALYDDTTSLQDRTVGTGVLVSDVAAQFAAGGYVGRGSGRNFDARKMPGYPPYPDLSFRVPVFTEGDVNARVWVRIREVEQSLFLLDQILDGMPRRGPLREPVAVDRAPTPHEGFALVEGFRGDVFAWVRLDNEGRVARCRLRDPSWFQWPLLEAVIENNIVADFPLCNKSFNCSYSGHDL